MEFTEQMQEIKRTRIDNEDYCWIPSEEEKAPFEILEKLMDHFNWTLEDLEKFMYRKIAHDFLPPEYERVPIEYLRDIIQYLKKEVYNHKTKKEIVEEIKTKYPIDKFKLDDDQLIELGEFMEGVEV